MNRFRLSRYTLVALASLFLCLFVASCGTDHRHSGDGAIWFVHATDPHIYKEKIEKKDLNTVTDEANKPKLQQLDEAALTALFQKISDLPPSYGPPAFLLITGDFGIDPCLITTPPLPPANAPNANKDPKVCMGTVDKDIRKAQIQNLAAILAKSPVPRVYFVAGNNDLPLESASKEALDYFNLFFKDLQDELATTQKSKIELFNLTSCYSDPKNASPCYEDVPKTSYRLIGFPSQSFKNRDGDVNGNKESLGQEVDQVALFQRALSKAASDDKRVIVVTHIPELDDPYLLGLDKYGKKGDLDVPGLRLEGPTPGVSAWNVNDKILTDWKNAVASNSVIAVFAGHLHDSHQEAYRRPYSWSTQTDSRIALNKLYLAPPLSMKKQDNSVFQARGFSTITLFPDSVEQRLYWYNSPSKTFTPDFFADPGHGNPRQSLPRRITGWFVWLWRVNTDLDRIATFLIALLTAFLTVVALWQIPPPDDPLAQKPASADPKAATATAAPNGTGGDSSPFTTRFGKTIIAGLGGLAVSEVAKALGNETLAPDLKWYYIICFISFFFVLLLGLNLLRASAEALRSRVAIIHYPLARVPRPKGKASDGAHAPDRKKEKPTPFRDGLSYWFLRILQWFFSLRVPVLTFFDTFINLIQGKNQTTTQAFTNELIDQQRNVIRVADTIRKKLQGRVQARLELAAAAAAAQQNPAAAQAPNAQTPHIGQVRVAISVLSADRTNVFYISRATGSSLTPFPKVSVAWVSVFTGLIRWYESFYQGKNILLFDNTDGTIQGVPSQLRLDDYYENRHADYEAFVVIPVPHPQRSFDSKYVKGAIHISFATNEDFAKIWNQPYMGHDVHVVPVPPPVTAVAAPVVPAPAAPVPPAPVPPAAAATPIRYPDPDHVLDGWCSDIEIQTALNDAVAVLGELLHGFNEIIYKNYIQPNQGD